MWKTMRLILPPNKKQSRFSEKPNKLNVEEKTIKNSLDFAKIFNNYFVKVSKTVADEILLTPPQICKKYMKNRIQIQFFFARQNLIKSATSLIS